MASAKPWKIIYFTKTKSRSKCSRICVSVCACACMRACVGGGSWQAKGACLLWVMKTFWNRTVVTAAQTWKYTKNQWAVSLKTKATLTNEEGSELTKERVPTRAVRTVTLTTSGRAGVGEDGEGAPSAQEPLGPEQRHRGGTRQARDKEQYWRRRRHADTAKGQRRSQKLWPHLPH